MAYSTCHRIASQAAEGRPGFHVQLCIIARLQLVGRHQGGDGLADELEEHIDRRASHSRQSRYSQRISPQHTAVHPRAATGGAYVQHPHDHPSARPMSADAAMAQRRAEQRGFRLLSLPVRVPPDKVRNNCLEASVPLPTASAATIGKGVWWYAVRGHPARAGL